MCKYMRIDMCIIMCMDMCIGMRIDMCIVMCIEMVCYVGWPNSDGTGKQVGSSIPSTLLNVS